MYDLEKWDVQAGPEHRGGPLPFSLMESSVHVMTRFLILMPLTCRLIEEEELESSSRFSIPSHHAICRSPMWFLCPSNLLAKAVFVHPAVLPPRETVAKNSTIILSQMASWCRNQLSSA